MRLPDGPSGSIAYSQLPPNCKSLSAMRAINRRGRSATSTTKVIAPFRECSRHDGPVATLDELYVRPDMRGQRFGHAMLEAACHLARERGAETLEINVDGEDTDARRFYEAHGFSNTEPGASEPMYFYYRELA